MIQPTVRTVPTTDDAGLALPAAVKRVALLLVQTRVAHKRCCTTRNFFRPLRGSQRPSKPTRGRNHRDDCESAPHQRLWTPPLTGPEDLCSKPPQAVFTGNHFNLIPITRIFCCPKRTTRPRLPTATRHRSPEPPARSERRITQQQRLRSAPPHSLPISLVFQQSSQRQQRQKLPSSRAPTHQP